MALSTGELTLDQAAAAAKHATPETDAELARIAVGKAPSQIARAARTLVPPKVIDDAALYKRRAAHDVEERRRELAFSGRCHSSKAPRSSRRSGASPSPSAPPTRRPADPRLATVCRGRARHARPERRHDQRRRRSPTTLIVHLSDDAPPMLEGAGPISPETAERLTCDARRLTIKPQRPRPRALTRRALRLLPAAARAAQALRHCQYPGCTAARELEAHHLIPGRARRQDRARQPHPALPPPPQAAPRPPHPHQRQRRAARSSRTRPDARSPPTSPTHHPADALVGARARQDQLDPRRASARAATRSTCPRACTAARSSTGSAAPRRRAR